MAKGKKQEDPNKVAQRKAERVAFVQSHPNLAPEVARQRFYVNTRAAELEAAGKPVDRAALREKFQSGGVTREGFYTPGDINRFNAARDNGSSLADTKQQQVTPTPPVVPSATNVPTGVLPTGTSRVQTPASSYQAPQTTTSLGQVVQPSTSYMGPRPSTPVRGGEPSRTAGPKATGTPARGGEPREPIFNQSGLTYTAPTTNAAEGREFSATVNRINPQAPANPKALAQQRGARIVAQNKARIEASNPLRAAQAKRVAEGYVAAPYDWTNMYRLGAGTLTVGAETVGTIFGGPVGGALAAGATYNLTNRLGNLLEQKTGFGGVKGDPGFEGDTSAKGFAVVAGGSLVGYGAGVVGGKAVQQIKSVIPGVKNAISDWATAAVEREGMTVAQQAAQRAQRAAIKGTKGESVIQLPKDLPFSGTNYNVITGTSSMPSVESETAYSVMQRMRQEPLSIGPVGNPGADRPLFGPPAPVKSTPAPKLTVETRTTSGLVIPGTARRTTQETVQAIESRTTQEAQATAKNIINDVVNGGTQKPLSLADTKSSIEAQLAEDGVKPVSSRSEASKKGWETRRANLKKLAEADIKVKGPETIGAAKTEPVPTPEPAPAGKGGLQVVEGNARIDAMRNHPAFRETLPETPPSLSVVKEETAVNVPPAKRPPTRRADESPESYAKRLKAWQTANEGEVFKAPAGFEETRGSISYQEKAMTRIESGMSRTNRSRTTAFVEEAGMSKEGFPVQMEGESIMQFNLRASEFLKARGKAIPEVPTNNFLAEGTPPSLAEVKATAATGDIPPKPSGLRNAAWDPETNQWRSRSKNKSGEYVFVTPRRKFATEAERQAATAERELNKQANRKASRAAASAEIKTKAKEVAASGGPNAEFGPFMFGGEPIGRSKVTLKPGEIPDWAQSNVSLTVPKLSESESVWLNRVPTAEEEAYFRELGNAKKASAGRRVTRGTREATPSDIQEYVRRMKGLRGGEKGLTRGPDKIAVTNTQISLEKEIEQVLGTDALTAIKNIAFRGNTPPLTQNIRGLESLAEIKASTEPLINKVVVRQPTPTSSGRLREQAATFFNAQGKLKGVSGADRIRTWNRLTQSDWFRQLQEREPSFANFLREQNAGLGEAFNTQLSEDVARTISKPKMRSTGWFGDKQMGPLERKLADREFDQTLVDNGLGAYDLKGEELVTGPKAGNRNEGTTLAQRAEAAAIENRAERFARLVRQVKAEDQAAFGDILYYNRGFERGQQLDPLVDINVTKDYGIVDEKGFTNIDAPEFRFARRQLDQPWQLTSGSVDEATADAIEAQRKEFVAMAQQGVISKAELNQRLKELRSVTFDQPSTALPANPFQQEFGTQLPDDYVRVLPESYGNVWDPKPWTDEYGIKREGRWISPQEAADKRATAAAKQAELTAKMELERANFYSDKWLAEAKRASLAAKSVKPEQTPLFGKSGPIKSEIMIRDEAQRLASLERKAAKIKAAGPQPITAEQYRFELKNPVFGPPKPARLKSSWSTDAASIQEEEARIAREMMSDFEQYDMDLGDIFGREGD